MRVVRRGADGEDVGREIKEGVERVVMDALGCEDDLDCCDPCEQECERKCEQSDIGMVDHCADELAVHDDCLAHGDSGKSST